MARFVLPLLIILGIAGFIFVNVSSHPNIIPSSSPGVISTATQTPIPSQSPTTQRSKVLIDVPFVSQSPTGNWSDSRQQDGCEEAAAYMAVSWATGKTVPSNISEQEKKLIDISDWEDKNFGSYHDTSAKDTMDRLYKGYFNYTNVELNNDVSIQTIKQALMDGKIIQVNTDGQALKNPFYTAPGPERHSLLIIGFDDKTKEFITNDNGTKRGKNYRYSYDMMIRAIRDYPTGDHLPITDQKKAMILISK